MTRAAIDWEAVRRLSEALDRATDYGAMLRDTAPWSMCYRRQAPLRWLRIDL